jgi:hypothetical protein
MSIDTPELTRLETLPTEILQAIVDHLPVWQIKHLSCASKRLRQACLSTLFRHVKFEFSQAGIDVCSVPSAFSFPFSARWYISSALASFP